VYGKRKNNISRIEDYDDGGTFIGTFDGEKLVGLDRGARV